MFSAVYSGYFVHKTLSSSTCVYLDVPGQQEKPLDLCRMVQPELAGLWGTRLGARGAALIMTRGRGCLGVVAGPSAPTGCPLPSCSPEAHDSCASDWRPLAHETPGVGRDGAGPHQAAIEPREGPVRAGAPPADLASGQADEGRGRGGRLFCPCCHKNSPMPGILREPQGVEGSGSKRLPAPLGKACGRGLPPSQQLSSLVELLLLQRGRVA